MLRRIICFSFPYLTNAVCDLLHETKDMAPLARKRRAERHQLRSKAARKDIRREESSGSTSFTAGHSSQSHAAAPKFYSPTDLYNASPMNNFGGLSASRTMLNPMVAQSLTLPAISQSICGANSTNTSQLMYNNGLLAEMERQRILSAVRPSLVPQQMSTMTSSLLGSDANNTSILPALLGSGILSGTNSNSLTDNNSLDQISLLTHTNRQTAHLQALLSSLRTSSPTRANLSHSSTQPVGPLLDALASIPASQVDLAQLQALLQQSNQDELNERLLLELLKRNVLRDGTPRT
jgi:hypothetical protein